MAPVAGRCRPALPYPGRRSMLDTPGSADSIAARMLTSAAAHGTPYSYPKFYRPPLLYPDVPFHEMLARTALRSPERPAIYWRDITLTYRELYSLALGGGL